MADPITTGLLVAATTGIGAYSSYRQAEQRNDSIKKSQKSVREAAQVNAQQVRDAGANELDKQRARLNRVRALIRVNAAESGGSVNEGSFAAFDRQALIDADYNRGITLTNQANQIRSIESGGSARIAELGSSVQNALLDAFMGGAQGAGTGLSISTSAKQLNII